MVSQKRKLVLVTGLSTQKAYELLSNSRHDVEHFRPDILQKVLDAGDVERGDEACGLFDAADKMNALVLTAVKHGYGPGMYVHSIVGFQKGYGEKALAALRDVFGPIWLMASPKPTNSKTGPKFGLNVDLLDGFYRKISWLTEFQLEDSIWHCPVSFFYSEGIDVEELSKFCQAEYQREL